MPHISRLYPTLILLPWLGIGLVCRPNAETGVREATASVRAIDKDLLNAQKNVNGQCKAMPEADAYRFALDTGMDTWDISEKKLATNEDLYEQALIGFHKDAREETLIGEYRLYTKKIQQAARTLAADYEGRAVKNRKQLAEGTFNFQYSPIPLKEAGRHICQAVIAVLRLEIQLQNETQKITGKLRPSSQSCLIETELGIVEIAEQPQCSTGEGPIARS